MNQIFAGLIFIAININIDIKIGGIADPVKFDILPEAIGYLLIAVGLFKLASESRHFKKIIIPTLTMVPFSLFSYLLDFRIMEIQYMRNYYYHMIIMKALLFAAVCYYIKYCIIKGLGDLEIAAHQDFKSKRLMSLWVVIVIIASSHHLSSLLSLYPVIDAAENLRKLNDGAMVISMFVLVIFDLIFLAAFNKAKKAYQDRIYYTNEEYATGHKFDYLNDLYDDYINNEKKKKEARENQKDKKE